MASKTRRGCDRAMDEIERVAHRPFERPPEREAGHDPR